MDGPTRLYDEAPQIDYIRRESFMPWSYRRRGYLKTAGATLILMLLVSGGYMFAKRNATTDVSVSAAVGQFRHESMAEDQGAPVAALQQKVDGPGQAVSGGRGPAQAASPVARQPVQAVSAAPLPYLLPPEGVYTYRTTGGEQISLGNAHHDYPPETTATLTHLGGCRWQIRNDVIKEHEDLRTYCSQTGDLFQDQQARWVTFYGKREGEDITFAPPQLVSAVTDKLGATSSSVGRDSQGDSATGTRTYLGRVPITVGSAVVQTVHVKVAGTMSGQSSGHFVDELWLDPATGMTIKWVRSVDSISNAFGASVHYTENASFLLESLVPQT